MITAIEYIHNSIIIVNYCRNKHYYRTIAITIVTTTTFTTKAITTKATTTFTKSTTITI